MSKPSVQRNVLYGRRHVDRASLVCALEPVVDDARPGPTVILVIVLATASISGSILAVSTQGAASRLELAPGGPAVTWQAVISAAWRHSARAILSKGLDERCDAVGCANGERKGGLGSGRLRHEQLRRMLVAASSKSKNLLVPLFCAVPWSDRSGTGVHLAAPSVTRIAFFSAGGQLHD
ncbi:uncharacterized protein TrAtP1_012951 [Trichoderma atroviride]|uniref:uncharacterized protein n=1 Tax=Hypocrea atroviridis TaxID=63577 RepID=UPI00332C0763|nr:hypothetical protein TrAtP1_012951 [Trichoderma atroviride]